MLNKTSSTEWHAGVLHRSVNLIFLHSEPSTIIIFVCFVLFCCLGILREVKIYRSGILEKAYWDFLTILGTISGNPCRNNSCVNGGVCSVNSNGALKCKCLKGYTGDFCKIREPIGNDASYYNISLVATLHYLHLLYMLANREQINKQIKTDRQTDRQAYWLTDWLTDWMSDWLMD